MSGSAARSAVVIQINGDAANFNNELKNIEKQTKDLGQTLSNVGIAAAAGFAVLTGAIGATIYEYQEHLKISAQTDAVLKSTGHSAGVSAEQVGTLASSLARMSNESDEAVQSAENIILRFTNIKSNIFPQTIQLALDMAAALGTDLTTAAQNVGKALNNPEKAITLLQRSGVQFTASQKDMIQSLIDTGKVAQAQQIILTKLQQSFGGSAKAVVDPFSQLAVAVSQVAQELGKTFYPAAAAVANTLKDIAYNLLDNHKKLLQFSAYALAAGAAVTGLVAALTLGGAAVLKFTAVTAALTAAAEGGSVAAGVFATAINGVTFALKAAFTTPIGLAIAGVVAIGVALYETSDKFKAFVQGSIAAASSMATSLAPIFAAIGHLILGAIATSPALIEQGFSDLKASVAKSAADAGKAFTDAYNQSMKNAKLTSPDNSQSLQQLLAQQKKFIAKGYELDSNNAKRHVNLAKELADDLYRTNEESRQLDLNRDAYVEDQKAQIALSKKKQILNDEAQFGKAYAQVQQFWRDKSVEATEVTFGQLATLTQSSNRDLFELGKASAVAMAIINTAQGVTRSLAEYPWPFNLIAAAATGLAGAVQIATIESQTLQAKEGYSGAGGVFGESFVSTFTPREIVVPERFADGIKRGEFSLSGPKDNSPAGGNQQVKVVVGFAEDASEYLELKSIERKKLGIALG